MKVYTKTGDKGTTSLYDGNRIGKEEIMFEVLGESDELTSRIGLFYSSLKTIKQTSDFLNENILYLKQVQAILQDMNSHIATIDKKKKLPEIDNSLVTQLESMIDRIDAHNEPLTNFILPGETVHDSFGHMCRVQTRKLERILWKYERADWNIDGKKSIDLSQVHVPEIFFTYINRLSDYFFVLCRFICKIQSI